MTLRRFEALIIGLPTEALIWAAIEAHNEKNKPKRVASDSEIVGLFGIKKERNARKSR